MVHHQPTCLFDPGMSTLDDPPFREDSEALGIRLPCEEVSLVQCTPPAHFGIGRMAHDLYRNAVLLVDRLRTAPRIASINKNC